MTLSLLIDSSEQPMGRAFRPCCYKHNLFLVYFQVWLKIESICLRIYKSTLYSYYIYFICTLTVTFFSLFILPHSVVFIYPCVYSPFSLSFILRFVEKRKPEMSSAIHAYELSFDEKRWIQSGKEDASKQRS